ncbi:MAG: FAD-binding protein [Desulfitobacteriaceae bacterium]
MTVQCDVLVIGGGAASVRAAIEANDRGASVALVMKGEFGTSGASAYRIAEMAGYNVADRVVDPTDSPVTHFEDIMRAAAGMADPKLAEILAEGALDSLRYLESLNVPFHKDEDGNYLEIVGCFASKPRMHMIPGHAEPVVLAEKEEIFKRQIPVYEWTIITRFLVTDNQIVGAMGLNREGEEVIFQTKAVVMGTGGAGQLFSYNINPPDITGDGYALGFQAGAELINMEFMQAGPGMIYPFKNMFNGWLWALHPHVLNGQGEEFIHKYLPESMTVEKCMDLRSGHYPFSCYDGSHWIDIAIKTEIAEGRGTPHGGVMVDLTGVNEDELLKTPQGRDIYKSWLITVNWLLENRNFDLRKTPVEVGILGHAISGGLLINDKCESTIQGLFAAGETAGGPHGADRLGGNMILACQVFGKRAGHFAAEFAQANVQKPLPQDQINGEQERLQQLRENRGSFSPFQIKKELQDIMWRHVVVTRSEEGLAAAQQGLTELRRRYQTEVVVFNDKELAQAVETDNLLLVGEVITRAALFRKESRGSHYRSDYPKRDDGEFLYRIVIRKEGQEIVFRTFPSALDTVGRYPYKIVHA